MSRSYTLSLPRSISDLQISIITAFRNSQKFIPDYVQMILRQTHSNWVCYLIDDNSSDGSYCEALSYISCDPRFKLMSLPFISSSGPSEARNFGLSQVNTELVAFCDIDDLWHPSKLELQLQFHCHYSLDISVTCFTRFVNKSSFQWLYHVIPPACVSASSILLRNPIPMSSVIVNKSLLVKSCPHEDYLYWIIFFKSVDTTRYGCLRQVLMYYRLHDANMSKNKLSVPFWTYSVYRNSGLPRSMALLRLVVWIFMHTASSILRLGQRPVFSSVELQMAQSPLLV